MEKLKFDFTFEKFRETEAISSESDLLLWMFHVDKIPPHVGISQSDLFFSLKSNGKDEIPVNNLIHIIENKNIKCIVLNIRYILDSQNIRDVFSRYDRAVSSKISCLSPIKEVLNTPDKVQKLSDLLCYLDDLNLIQEICCYNVTNDELGILKYDVSEIDNRLNLLHA